MTRLPSPLSLRPRRTDGPATDVREVDGVSVVDRLAVAAGRGAQLVRLADGRLAFIGDVVAVGRPRQVMRWLRSRMSRDG